ncbi:MAG: beta-aspartyl-peptidase [Desulfobacterales bacterium]
MKPNAPKPFFTLIRGAQVFAPEPCGRNDILLAGEKIAHIAPKIDLPRDWDALRLPAEGRLAVPGFIDLHVHLLGGGGEAGPASRAPAITLSRITRAGVTTVVGLLGTDDVTRRPESLLAKALQLSAEGISAFLYSGSYQLPPATITGSLRKDLALLPAVIGVKIAISDHRSSQPSFEELCRLAAEARVGGMLGGKAGLVHLHVGAGPRGLEPLRRLLKETEIPVGQFLPTHVNRTPALLEEAIAFAREGGFIDLTARGRNLQFRPTVAEAVRQALAAGVPLDQISLSSDSNGSMPVFDARGRLLRLAVGEIESLTEDWRRLVREGLPLEQALRLVTENPARRAGLFDRKGSLAPGKDADLLLLDRDLEIVAVFARGRRMVERGKALVKGTFEA